MKAYIVQSGIGSNSTNCVSNMNAVNLNINGAGIVENSIPSNELNPESSNKNLLPSSFANTCSSYSNYHEVAMNQRNSSLTSSTKALRNTVKTHSNKSYSR